jgi:hypothetical protein
VPDASFVGGWGVDQAQCQQRTAAGQSPLTISDRSAEAFGAVCDFISTQRETLRSWRIQATCRHNGAYWNANIHFTLRGNRLTWSSERGTITYVRCPDLNPLDIGPPSGR